MTFVIAVALLVCIVGAVVHLIPNRASTLGGHAFAVGLFWVLASIGSHVLRLS